MWTEELFQVQKPILALLHLRALPGDPLFRPEDTIEQVVKQAREELCALQEGGVDGILIANEFSLPYEREASPVTLSAMAYILGRLRETLRIPFGVNVVRSPMATIEMAAAVGADFVRNTFTGAYVGESGITDTDAAASVRRRKALGAERIRMLYKVNPESDVYLNSRPIQKITKSLIFHCFPDGICVSGDSAGSETSTELIRQVKEVSGSVPVFCNTGCNQQNIAQMLEFADGACVGTAFKTDGKFDGHAEKERVKAFMEAVKEFRRSLR